MSRSACIFGVAAWLAAPAAAASASGKYATFCQMRGSDGQLTNSCNRYGQCNGTGALVAQEVFTVDDGVCEGFSASGPVCEAAEHHCYEAVDFQLVWDRNKDFVNDYSHEDWFGISLMFHNTSAIFVPGSSAFSHKGDVQQALAALHSRQPGLVRPVVKQVLTMGKELDDGRTVHATGIWKFDGATNDGATELPWYARWMTDRRDHWVMESLVTQLGSKLPMAASEQEDPSLFEEISTRAAHFADLYNAGKIDQLESMYSKSAVIIPAEGRPIEKTDAARFFGTKPLGSEAKLESKIVARAPGNDGVHEVGYSDSTGSGYLARWVKEGKSDWVIETQLFAVFPKNSFAETEIIV